MSKNEVYLKYPALAPMGYAFHPCGIHFLAGVSVVSIDADNDEHLAQYERVTGKFGRLSEGDAAQELIMEIEARASGTSAKAHKFRDAIKEAIHWNSSGILSRNDVHAAALAALNSNRE